MVQWDQFTPDNIMACGAFLPTNPRPIPQDEYNIGDINERTVLHTGIGTASSAPDSGWSHTYHDFVSYAIDYTQSIVNQLENVFESHEAL